MIAPVGLIRRPHIVLSLGVIIQAALSLILGLVIMNGLSSTPRDGPRAALIDA